MHRTPTRSEAVARIIAFGLRTILTLLAAGLLVAQANGYEIDFQSFSVRKVGLLVVVTTPREAVVRLSSGEILDRVNGPAVAQLVPGSYAATVSHSTHQPWTHSVRIEEGRSVAFPNVTLFLAQPVVGPSRAAAASELRAPLVDPRLDANDGELWLRTATGRELVSRFSYPLSSAVLVDRTHVAFIAQGALHGIDSDGSNDQILLTDVRPGNRVLVVSSDELGLLNLEGAVTPVKIR